LLQRVAKDEGLLNRVLRLAADLMEQQARRTTLKAPQQEAAGKRRSGRYLDGMTIQAIHSALDAHGEEKVRETLAALGERQEDAA
jgi:hypothetical protein